MYGHSEEHLLQILLREAFMSSLLRNLREPKQCIMGDTERRKMMGVLWKEKIKSKESSLMRKRSSL